MEAGLQIIFILMGSYHIAWSQSKAHREMEDISQNYGTIKL